MDMSCFFLMDINLSNAYLSNNGSFCVTVSAALAPTHLLDQKVCLFDIIYFIISAEINEHVR